MGIVLRGNNQKNKKLLSKIFIFLKKLPQYLTEKLYESCISDMCQFQMNKLQQQKAKCDNFERLSQACYDIGITNFDWRTKSNCRKFNKKR